MHNTYGHLNSLLLQVNCLRRRSSSRSSVVLSKAATTLHLLRLSHSTGGLSAQDGHLPPKVDGAFFFSNFSHMLVANLGKSLNFLSKFYIFFFSENFLFLFLSEIF